MVHSDIKYEHIQKIRLKVIGRVIWTSKLLPILPIEGKQKWCLNKNLYKMENAINKKKKKFSYKNDLH